MRGCISCCSMFCVVSPVFVRPVRPLCYREIEISVHNIELAPISNSRF